MIPTRYDSDKLTRTTHTESSIRLTRYGPYKGPTDRVIESGGENADSTKSSFIPSHLDNRQDWWFCMSVDDFDYATASRDYPPPCPWCSGRLVHSDACKELTASWVLPMPWGKHKGKPVTKVPRDYLRWILANSESLTTDLRSQIEGVLCESH